MEVQRLINSSGIITLANQAIQVGSPLAGQRARIRLDGQVMHVITQDGVLWRTLPCPVPPGQRHKLQGVRLAEPQPLAPASPVIQRKVSSRGLAFATQPGTPEGESSSANLCDGLARPEGTGVSGPHARPISITPATARRAIQIFVSRAGNGTGS